MFQSPHQFSVSPIMKEDHKMAVSILKKYFLSEHVLVQARKMDLSNDRALDEYLVNLLQQGNLMPYGGMVYYLTTVTKIQSI